MFAAKAVNLFILRPGAKKIIDQRATELNSGFCRQLWPPACKTVQQLAVQQEAVLFSCVARKLSRG